ncbi:S-layer homology domain-containing protein [Clostridiaceae bacterium M8S5]|nr:S-layer homology domain-containing protein [Clostridiaceae bacterium M8S5]
MNLFCFKSKLTTCLCIIIIAILLSTTILATDNSFSDINSNDWYTSSIKLLVEKNIINGYPDNTFRPNENINVDAFLKIVITSLNHDIQKYDGYWALGYINKAIELKLIDESEFEAYNVPITRGQMAKIIVKCIDIPENEDFSVYSKIIPDYNSINNSYKDYVLSAFASGIITGYPSGEFKENENATRAQSCIIINRMLDKNLRKVPNIPNNILTQYPKLEKKMYLDKEKELSNFEQSLYTNTKVMEEKVLTIESQMANLELFLNKKIKLLVSENKPHVYDNGDLQYGYREDGNYDSETLIILKSGTKLYYTNYKNSSANGNGMILWEDGDKYIGNFKNGKKHGKGKYVFKNSNEYIGYFKNGDFDGLGIYKYIGNERYIGNFYKDLKSGLGTYYFSNGDKYIGNFKNELFDGKGVFISATKNKSTNHLKYIGSFKGDKRYGFGASYWTDGSKYIGYFNGTIDRSKHGCYIYNNGDLHIRNDVVDEITEKGKYIWSDGLTYIGLFDLENNRLSKDPLYYSPDKEKSIFNDVIDDILRKIIDSKMSDLQKEKAIHDYIINNTVYYKYDKDSIKDIPEYCHTAYGVLIYGTGVCDGYAEATNVLLNRVGIESKLVFGHAKNKDNTDTIGHAWNLVKIDGKYYHLDVTWDDDDENQKACYDFFNLTDEEMRKTHKW